MILNELVKAPLSKIIQKEYNKLVLLIASIEPSEYDKKNIQGTGGLVSIRDIVAYQIGWGTLLLTWYKQGLKGKKPEMPGQGFTKWDYVALAHHFYKNYQGGTFEEQKKTFKDIVEKIIAMTETEYATGNLDKIGVWPWCTLASGKQWPLSKWITVNSASAYKRATGLIKRVQ